MWQEGERPGRVGLGGRDKNPAQIGSCGLVLSKRWQDMTEWLLSKATLVLCEEIGNILWWRVPRQGDQGGGCAVLHVKGGSGFDLPTSIGFWMECEAGSARSSYSS